MYTLLLETPVYGARVLRVVFDRPVTDPLRSCLADFAPYLDPKVQIPKNVLDQMFEVAQEPLATPMFFVAMIFYARAKLPERDDTFAFCRRLYTGNIYSKNLALRIASLIVYIEALEGEHLEFVEQMLVDLWTGREASYSYPAKKTPNSPVELEEIPVGYLQFPVIHECRVKTGGGSDFISKILALPWSDDPSRRLIRIIDCLDDGLCIAAATQNTNIAPMLGTIYEWAASEDDRVRARLVQFLCSARSFYPGQVDQFLDGLMDGLSTRTETQSRCITEVVRDVREGFKLYPLSRLYAGSGIVEVPWLLQRSKMFVQFFW